MNLKIFNYLSLLLVIFSNNILATEKNLNSWNNLTITYLSKFHDNYYFLLLQSETRFNLSIKKKYDRTLNTMSVGQVYDDGSIFSVGYDYTPIKQDEKMNIEGRFWQQYSWYNIDKIDYKVTSQFKLEEVLRNKNSGINNRLRSRIQLTIPFFKNKFQFILFEELFLNIINPNWVSSSIFDQNRIFIGIEQKFQDDDSMIYGFMNQYINGINSSFKNTQNNNIYLNYRARNNL